MNLSVTIQILFTAFVAVSTAGADYRCQPTPVDAQGPFYRPDAPETRRLGQGYLLSGTVKAATDCQPISEAKIEVWMTGPDGRYDDRWRATLYSGPTGHYQLESFFPGPYGSRPPHIHIIVNAEGFQELVTQHYPVPGQDGGIFDLVLRPR